MIIALLLNQSENSILMEGTPPEVAKCLTRELLVWLTKRREMNNFSQKLSTSGEIGARSARAEERIEKMYKEVPKKFNLDN